MESMLVQIVIRAEDDQRGTAWTLVLYVGGAEVPTGIRAGSPVEVARMLTARLAGTAP